MGPCPSWFPECLAASWFPAEAAAAAAVAAAMMIAFCRKLSGIAGELRGSGAARRGVACPGVAPRGRASLNFVGGSYQ